VDLSERHAAVGVQHFESEGQALSANLRGLAMTAGSKKGQFQDRNWPVA